MGPYQRKLRFRMVKAVERLPVCSRVAGFAADRRAVRELPFHRFAELPLVWIHVTARTGTVVKSIFHGRWRSRWNNFMAIRAKDSDVRAGQRETGLFVARQRKPRRLEALQVVTRFATVLMRRSGKLPFVNILVTVFAFSPCDFV